MTVIRRADADEFSRDAIVLDLGNLEARGEALINQARAQAAALIAEGQAERARLIKDAHKTGFEAGLEEGRQQGLEEGRRDGRSEAFESVSAAVDSLTASWSNALEVFEGARASLVADAHEQLIRLACDIAGRATARLIEFEPQLVVNQLAEILSIALQSSRLTVRVHPEDQVFLEEAMPKLLTQFSSNADVALESDGALPRGSCVAVTDTQGVLDASIDTKLDRLVSAVLPESGGDA